DQVTRDLEAYRFNDAAMALYRFVWNDYCDWYLELAKPRFLNPDDPSGAAARGILARVLRDVLGMLHPFTPFLTEKLWAALHDALGEPAPSLLMNAAWPSVDGARVDRAAEEEMALVQEVLHAVRQVRTLT